MLGKAEIEKWINKHGPTGLGQRKLLEPFALCDAKGKGEVEVMMKRFAKDTKPRSILISSYETLRMYTPVLKTAAVDMIICDEGIALA